MLQWRNTIAPGMGAALLGLVLTPLGASAADITPSFDGAPTGWTTYRYQPESFGDVGTYQGRDDVLGIGIHRNQGATARPDLQAAYYNLQGMKQAISGGSGDALRAGLYIEPSWADEQNGTIHSNLWGRMDDGTDFTMSATIGFTNEGGTPRYRIWDSPNGVWIDLAVAVAFGAWVDFEIALDGGDFVYSINGAEVLTETETWGSTNFHEIVIQSYNFFDPDLVGVVPVNYTAHWSNLTAAEVPEPDSLVLLGLGITGLGMLRARRRRT